mmetsp:Transcript_38205/g.43610  ORF Transcript_38205/g.43610 Transcript_38205/m.43610 type:complete len:103 (-) Transcript_38205:185-493(-)
MYKWRLVCRGASMMRKRIGGTDREVGREPIIVFNEELVAIVVVLSVLKRVRVLETLFCVFNVICYPCNMGSRNPFRNQSGWSLLAPVDSNSKVDEFPSLLRQ